MYRYVFLILFSISLYSQNNTIVINGYIDGCYPYWNNGSIETEIYLFSNGVRHNYFVKGGTLSGTIFYLSGFALPYDGTSGTFYIDTVFRAIRYIEPDSLFNVGTQSIQLDSIVPNYIPAGTNRLVTLYGKGFGNIPGKVKFNAGAKDFIYIKDFTTWSDNIIRCKVPVGVTARGFYGGANSGNVVVYTDSNYSNGKYLYITYVTKFKWPSSIFGYYFSPQLLNIPAYNILPAIGRAAQSWILAGSDLRLLYYGNRYPYLFTMEMNDKVEICFTSDIPDYVPAITYVKANMLTGNIIESDITFNVNTQWSTTYELGKVDLEGTALHEFGHFLGLLDVEEAGKAMNKLATQRTLHKWEGQALIDMYGGVSSVNYKSEFNINGVFPNPFNSSAIFTYTLYEKQNVNISIYSILGQKLMTLVDDNKSIGTYSIIISLKDYTSGIYYLKFNKYIYKLVYLR